MLSFSGMDHSTLFISRCDTGFSDLSQVELFCFYIVSTGVGKSVFLSGGVLMPLISISWFTDTHISSQLA